MAERIVAVLMGTSAALFAILVTLALAHPDRTFARLPAWVHRATIPLENPAREEGGAGQPGTLRVSAEGVRDRFEPIVKRDIGADRTTVRAVYSGHWAEQRVVVLDLRPRSVSVLALFETDDGDFPAWVVTAESTVHVHADKACFDLRVRRLDGSSVKERWSGSIPLD